jgi:hypothetical protein
MTYTVVARTHKVCSECDAEAVRTLTYAEEYMATRASTEHDGHKVTVERVRS